jgi:CDP-diacylglycerol--glycerol-3-phosphate 3-phosphatidyltransferase
MAAAAARAPMTSAAAPSRALVAAPTPTGTLLRPRGARLPLLPPPSSIGRSGTSSFKGGSGTSSFSSASPSDQPRAASTAAAAEGIGRSGASAFSGSRGRSGASSFGQDSATPSTPSTTTSSFLKSLPTALTVARVLAIPLVVRLWFCSSPAAPLWCAVLFAASCFTDWLDGFLARRLDASTPFGAFLDPVADKLTVATTLVLLSTRPPLPPSPLAADLAWLVPLLSAAIINREIAMSALREWAATLGPEARATVAVGSLGKIKTAAQMSAIVLLLLTREGAASAASVGLSAAAFEAAAVAGPPLLMVAAALTKLSLFQYIVALWPWISGKKKAGGGGAVVA